MAEPLKLGFGPEVPRRIGRMIRAVHPGFPYDAYVRETLRGYDALELMPRARHIAHALRRHLPPAYVDAIGLLVASAGPPLAEVEGDTTAPFLYLPHVLFVAEYGLDDFEASMEAQHALTQRFTAEFSLRPFLVHHTQRTLARLAQWTAAPSVHVRRLVSEGTRPRLPWAPRLRIFQEDPTPVLALLERLKDDPEPYVRRSVANNLNDIGKDHPAVLLATARQWLRQATAERRWIVERALRSLVKQGDAEALALLGYARSVGLAVRRAEIRPRRIDAGGTVAIALDVHNATSCTAPALVDFRIHFVKANGKTAAKVFKLKRLTLQPGESIRCSKTVSLAEMTTRKHYAGRHAVEALVNGVPHALGHFDLVSRSRSGD